MPTFSAPDGTMLAYHESGDGTPVVCVPGGPMMASVYLDDLGGLDQRVRLIRLDLRGTGDSEAPADVGTCRVDQQVGDVEALREALGLDRFNLLAHSAGANLAALYAQRHPDRVERLALITPSVFAVGIEATADDRRAMIALRTDEPWHAEGAAAFERIAGGDGSDDDWELISPFLNGRWDEVAQREHALEDERRNEDAAQAYNDDGAYDPTATRAALGELDCPVLVLAGGVDIGGAPQVVEKYAALFRAAEFVVQPGAGHYPWRDDPAAFARTVGDFFA